MTISKIESIIKLKFIMLVSREGINKMVLAFFIWFVVIYVLIKTIMNNK